MRIGLIDFAQKMAGEISFVKLPKWARKLCRAKSSFPPGTPMAGVQLVNYREIARLVAEARLACLRTYISFSCATPCGKEKDLLEKSLIDAGVNAMAYPEESSIAYAETRDLACSFVEKCCSCV